MLRAVSNREERVLVSDLDFELVGRVKKPTFALTGIAWSRWREGIIRDILALSRIALILPSCIVRAWHRLS